MVTLEGTAHTFLIITGQHQTAILGIIIAHVGISTLILASLVMLTHTNLIPLIPTDTIILTSQNHIDIMYGVMIN